MYSSARAVVSLDGSDPPVRMLTRLGASAEDETCDWRRDPKVMACGDAASHMLVVHCFRFLCTHHAIAQADEWGITLP